MFSKKNKLDYIQMIMMNNKSAMFLKTKTENGEMASVSSRVNLKVLGTYNYLVQLY